MHAVFIRAPWVEEAGAGVEVLGRVVGGAADGRIVAVRQGNLVATSFHPELTGDRRVHALFVDIVRDHLAEQAGASTPGTRRQAMSGHSKWATTKHKKAGIDAKRGKLFAKLIKNIEVAARTGGGDPSGNPTLFDAIQKAKKTSVPNDNIDRAVKRGSGAEAGGVDYQGITYEGYAAGGVAVLIECLTDNKNRSAMEVRTAMTRNGGSMADPGSVSYLFSRKGVVVVPQGRRRRRGRRAHGRAGRRRRGGPRPRRHLRGGQRADRPGGGAHRAAGRRHRLRLGRGRLRAQRDRRARRGRAPARCSG